MNVPKSPLVSVIFPVYNVEAFLTESLYSLLNQSYVNIEVIALNDGSSDNSLAILTAIADKDKRVIVVNQPNQGLVKTLNKGVALARGNYIARMDSDDLSFPHRFERQVAEFRKDPEVVLVAGTFEVIDNEGEYIYREVMPVEDADIKRAMYTRNPIAHGSVMFKKEAFLLAGGYNDECGPTEDYELWSRMAGFGKFVGIEQAIFRWRVNPDGITSTKKKSVEHFMAQNLKAYWTAVPPIYLSTKELRAIGKHYLKTYKKHGVYMKLKITSDAVGLGVKLIRRREIIAGSRQLIAVALTGRAGLRITIEKVWVILRNVVRNRGFEEPGEMLVVNPKDLTPPN